MGDGLTKSPRQRFPSQSVRWSWAAHSLAGRGSQALTCWRESARRWPPTAKVEGLLEPKGFAGIVGGLGELPQGAKGNLRSELRILTPNNTHPEAWGSRDWFGSEAASPRTPFAETEPHGAQRTTCRDPQSGQSGLLTLRQGTGWPAQVCQPERDQCWSRRDWITLTGACQGDRGQGLPVHIWPSTGPSQPPQWSQPLILGPRSPFQCQLRGVVTTERVGSSHPLLSFSPVSACISDAQHL